MARRSEPITSAQLTVVPANEASWAASRLLGLRGHCGPWATLSESCEREDCGLAPRRKRLRTLMLGTGTVWFAGWSDIDG
jgi:hypothetical protein